MPHLFCFGLGFSAQALARRLAAQGWTISGTNRDGDGGSLVLRWHKAASSFCLRRRHASLVVGSTRRGWRSGPQLSSRRAGARPLFVGWAISRRPVSMAIAAATGWTRIRTWRPTTRGRSAGRRRRGMAGLEPACACLPPRRHLWPGPQPARFAARRHRQAHRQAGPGLQPHPCRRYCGRARGLDRKTASGRVYNVCDDEPCPPQDVVAFAAELLQIRRRLRSHSMKPIFRRWRGASMPNRSASRTGASRIADRTGSDRWQPFSTPASRMISKSRIMRGAVRRACGAERFACRRSQCDCATLIPRVAHNQFIGKVGAFPKCPERRAQPGFVFKCQIVNRREPGDCVGHFIARPVIETAQNPVRLGEHQVTDKVDPGLFIQQAKHRLELSFIIPGKITDKDVGIERGHRTLRRKRSTAFFLMAALISATVRGAGGASSGRNRRDWQTWPTSP